MTQFLKCIVLVLMVSSIIISPALFAQNIPAEKDSLFNAFIELDNRKTNNGSDFICTITITGKSIFIKKYGHQIKRQLNDTTFIISLKKPANLKEDDLKFSRIKKANSLWKLSPPLFLQTKNQSFIFPLSLLISVDTSVTGYQNLLKDYKLNSTTISNIFTGTIKNYTALNNLLNNETVLFISALAKYPKEELQINDLDLSVNKINLLHSNMPALNGDGITISIKENLPDTTDIDFGARYVYNPLAATKYSSHATIIATMAAGAGNSYYLGKGVASAASINSSNFNNLLPDADSNYRQYSISVQNHSYGVGIENFYGADAAAYDESAVKNDSLLFVFSAGNSGNLSAPSGKYSGIKNFANITGSFKMAKNILTVGAVDSLNIVTNFSSRGPAFDGRICPSITAYGEDGTSGAAAIVSGTAAVLQQAFKTLHNNLLPSGALIKAILINSADGVVNTSLNYISGYGNLNTFKAVKTVLSSSFFEGIISDNNEKTFKINIPSNISKAKFTLVWNDAPAQANAYIALVNDLDMELKFIPTNQLWLPWVLNSFANADSLSALPLRKRDSLNTIEQITIDNPVAGNYQLLVKGFNIPAGVQKFYIAYQFDTTNNFQFNFPAAADNIFSGAVNIIKWDTNLTTDSSKLFYTINQGNTWQSIDTFIKLHKNYYYWNTPDTNTTAQLKMQAGNKVFFSDQFTISSKLNLKVGFNCTDSVLIYWNKLPGVLNYQILTLQGKYLLPALNLGDTFLVFNKANIPYKQLAVAPVFGKQVGVKSYTTNYTQQGVDCYVSNFLGDLKADTSAMLQLQLGTSYFVKKIVFEKLKQGIFKSIKELDFVDGLHFTWTDRFLQNAENIYRAHIILNDGRNVYSNASSVFYFKNTSVSIYPNPVVQNNTITIHLKDLDNQLIDITDISGRSVFKKQASGNIEKIFLPFLKGLYILTVTNPDKRQTVHTKIILL